MNTNRINLHEISAAIQARHIETPMENVTQVSAETDAAEAAEILREHSFDRAPVKRGNAVVGIFTALDAELGRTVFRERATVAYGRGWHHLQGKVSPLRDAIMHPSRPRVGSVAELIKMRDRVSALTKAAEDCLLDLG